MFDWGLINDEVYSIAELTTLKLRGKWNAVEYVADLINDMLND